MEKTIKADGKKLEVESRALNQSIMQAIPTALTSELAKAKMLQDQETEKHQAALTASELTLFRTQSALRSVATTVLEQKEMIASMELMD